MVKTGHTLKHLCPHSQRKPAQGDEEAIQRTSISPPLFNRCIYNRRKVPSSSQGGGGTTPDYDNAVNINKTAVFIAPKNGIAIYKAYLYPDGHIQQEDRDWMFTYPVAKGQALIYTDGDWHTVYIPYK